MMQPFTNYILLPLFPIIAACYLSGVAAAAEERTFDCTICQLASMPARGEPTIPHQTVCKIEDSESYVSLDGDIDEFCLTSSSFPLEMGRTQLSIPTSLLTADMHLNLDNPRASELIVISQRHSRKVEHRVGTWNVLAVRVIDSTGDAPTKSKRQLGTDIFDDSFNLDNSAQACSKGQLRFKAATGDAVVNGVIDVRLSKSMSNYSNDSEVRNEALSLIPTDSSAVNDYTFTILVMPDSSKDYLSGAKAWLPGKVSWYRDLYGSDPTYLLHELGHNLGHGHSGNGNYNEYGDPTCMMGGGGYSNGSNDDKGKMCFNAAKTYYFGWFSEYHQDVDPSTSPYVGQLVGTNDVVNDEISSEQDMIVKLHSNGETDLFMMYQKTEGITEDIDSDYETTFNNHVVIVEQSGDSRDSWVKASLAPGDVYTQKNWNGGTLVVQACSITPGTPDVAKVISFVDGKTTASCFPTESSTESRCVDTDKRFVVKNKLINGCTWVKRNPGARCKRKSVSSMCPLSCGTCGYENCTDGGLRFQQNKRNKWTPTCSWIKQRPERIREKWCSKSGVSQICRHTCGHCASERKRNVFSNINS